MKRLYTIPEIIAQFDSGEYSAELLLHHAMKYIKAAAPLFELARVDKDSLTSEPDADGWIKHDPSGPVPEKHKGVRFGDGEEDFDPGIRWMPWRWYHDGSSKGEFITHYKP